MLFQILKDMLSLLYQTLGFSVLFAFVAMFFFIYAKECGGYKVAIKKWAVLFKSDAKFRYLFVFVIYIMILLHRTLFNRDMWSNPLSNIIGIWSLVDGDGNFTAEIPENILLFMPFGFLIFLIRSYEECKKVKSIALYAVKFSFMFSIGIECCQLFLRLGTFQLSDLFFNTLGGLLGGLIYWIFHMIHTRDKQIDCS